METIIAFIQYISSVPYFWSSMGMVVALGMFVGALLYKGNINELAKVVFVVLSYVVLILWFNISRVYFLFGIRDELDFRIMALSSSAVILFISVFWLMGIVLGTAIIKFSKH